MSNVTLLLEGKFLTTDEEVAEAMEELKSKIKREGQYDPAMRITSQSRSCKGKPDCPNRGLSAVAFRYREFVVLCRSCLADHIKIVTALVWKG